MTIHFISLGPNRAVIVPASEARVLDISPEALLGLLQALYLPRMFAFIFANITEASCIRSH